MSLTKVPLDTLEKLLRQGELGKARWFLEAIRPLLKLESEQAEKYREIVEREFR
jgi:hypothetical protein